MYELSEAAAKDIEKILERSVVDFGLARTELYISSLKSCLEILGENPGMGSVADDIRPDYRRFAHQSHLVFYRDSGQGILIARILHKRMDINKHIAE